MDEYPLFWTIPKRNALQAMSYFLENGGRDPSLTWFDDSKESLLNSFQEVLREYKHKLEILTEKLIANSPLEILKKGYAVVTDKKSGKVLVSTEPVETGDEVHIRLYKGEMDAEVKGKD